MHAPTPGVTYWHQLLVCQSMRPEVVPDMSAPESPNLKLAFEEIVKFSRIGGSRELVGPNSRELVP